MTKRKVFLVGPALTMGGMQRATVNFAELFDSLGFDVVVCVLVKREHFFKLPSHISIIEPENFNLKRIEKIKTIKWLNSEIKKREPDFVFAIQKFAASIVAAATMFIKIPYVLSERSSPNYNWGTIREVWMKTLFMLNPPKFCLAQTKYAANFQKKYYSKQTQIEVFPNLLRSVKKFEEIKRENYILAIGRFGDYLKGFDQLLNAFSLIKDSSWKLVFVGGSSENWEYKDLAKDLGVIDKIIFTGSLTDTDVWMAKASIFVIPSRSEGFPNALIEAMAAGLCVVAFNFQAGPNEIIENNVNGILVENGNIIELGDCLNKLISNCELRLKLGEQAEITSKIYSPEMLKDKMLKLVSNIF
jgi:GalNAc-alpha-(1->4)-GalNAc-alpha-(1->3)-diNAcBac-PP-undecaprenol alpha-1,4-N-acetyl-D-galactosaminyltransferase